MFTELTQQFARVIHSFVVNFQFCAIVVLVLLVIEIINVGMKHRLNALGIVPRTGPGLIGIIFSPLLHGNFSHLIFNLIPLYILMNLILIFGHGLFWKVTFFIWLVEGGLVWLMGRKALHVGASGVVFGYWGFLLTNAVTNFNLLSVILAILCLYYFSNMIFGIFPTDKASSWEGHLFGLAAGILASLLFL